MLSADPVPNHQEVSLATVIIPRLDALDRAHLDIDYTRRAVLYIESNSDASLRPPPPSYQLTRVDAAAAEAT